LKRNISDSGTQADAEVITTEGIMESLRLTVEGTSLIPSREVDICCRTPDNSSFTGSHRVEHKIPCLQQLGLRPKPEPKSAFDSVQIGPSE
jgi:hypothetical protein